MADTVDRIDAKRNALVTLYAAVCFSLITLLHLELERNPMVSSFMQWILTALLCLLVCTFIFSIRFPSFRVRIFNARDEDITLETNARLTVLWALAWRLVICFIPGSIIFGLGGAAIVVLMTKFSILMTGSWLIYPVSFFCFFIAFFIVLYPTFFWWLRLFGSRLCIGIVSSKPPEEPQKTLDKNRM